MDESSLSQEDARFMLVICSAITNYLTVKADKAGVKISAAATTRLSTKDCRQHSNYVDFAPPTDDFAPPPDDFAPPPLDVGEIPF